MDLVRFTRLPVCLLAGLAGSGGVKPVFWISDFGFRIGGIASLCQSFSLQLSTFSFQLKMLLISNFLSFQLSAFSFGLPAGHIDSIPLCPL